MIRKLYKNKTKKSTIHPHGTSKQIHLADLIKAGILSIGDELVDNDNIWSVKIHSEDGKISANGKVYFIQKHTNRLLPYVNCNSKFFNKENVSFWEFWNLRKRNEAFQFKVVFAPLLELKKQYEEKIASQQKSTKVVAGKTKNLTSKKERYEIARNLSKKIVQAVNKPKIVWRVFETKQACEDEKATFEKEINCTDKDFYIQFRDIERQSKKYWKAELIWYDTNSQEHPAFWTTRAYKWSSKNTNFRWLGVQGIHDWIDAQTNPLAAAEIELRTIDNCRYYNGETWEHDGFDCIHLSVYGDEELEKVRTILAKYKIGIAEEEKDGNGYSFYIKCKDGEIYDSEKQFAEMCNNLNSISWTRFEFGSDDFHNGFNYVRIDPSNNYTINEVKELLAKNNVEIVEEMDDGNTYLIFINNKTRLNK